MSDNVYSKMAASLIALGVENTPERLAPYFALCKMFPDQVVNQAAMSSLWKFNRRPYPADVANLLKQIIGEDHESLMRRGVVSFRTLLEHNDCANDLICDDWRAVYAIKHAFGSLYQFYQNFEDLNWRQKRFAEAYACVDYLEQNTVNKEFLLKGTSNVLNESFRRTKFLGDYDQCMSLLQSLPNASDYRAPADPRVLASLPPVDNYQVLSEEEVAKSKALLAEVLNRLGRSNNEVKSA